MRPVETLMSAGVGGHKYGRGHHPANARWGEGVSPTLSTSLIENISAKRERLLATSAAPAGVSLGKARATADEAVASLQESETRYPASGPETTPSGRTTPPKYPTVSAGWTLPLRCYGEVDDLTAFADEVRRAGIEHVVLLGMGGSSLGPEVLSQVLWRNRRRLPGANCSRLHPALSHQDGGQHH